MRLKNSDEILKIVNAADSNAKVYLYGSRINDDMKGGDIDLLVISEQLKFSDKIDILTRLKKSLGEQKIDLTIKSESQLEGDSFFLDLFEKQKIVEISPKN